MPNEDDIISTKQAAAILNVSTHRVRVLCQKGRLDCFKLGREWLIRLESVESYERGQPGRPPKSSTEEE